MNRLRQGLIILVAGLFLPVVSIGGALAADKSKLPETKSNEGIKTTDQQPKDTERVQGDRPFKEPRSTKPDRQILPKQKKTEDEPPLRKGLINRPDIPKGLNQILHLFTPKTLKNLKVIHQH